MMANYEIDDNYQYDSNIKELENNDRASASEVFNPLIKKLVNNTHAVKRESDKALENAESSVKLGADGKLAPEILPALAISDTFVVNTQAAMLALTAETGDIAVRTDENKTYILITEPATLMSNWQELLSPGKVLSVNGKTGVVSLSKNDLNLDQIDNTSDVNKPVSTAQQTAISKKADQSSLSAHEMNTVKHITGTERTNWNSAHTHAADAVKHITAAERTLWSSGGNNAHSHSNKAVLDKVTDAQITKLNGVAEGANKYTHPSFTVATAGETANKTLSYGGSFKVVQTGRDANGHLSTQTERTMTMPVLSNNLITTTPGTALDATQGKILNDKIHLVSDTYVGGLNYVLKDQETCELDVSNLHTVIDRSKAYLLLLRWLPFMSTVGYNTIFAPAGLGWRELFSPTSKDKFSIKDSQYDGTRLKRFTVLFEASSTGLLYEITIVGFNFIPLM